MISSIDSSASRDFPALSSFSAFPINNLHFSSLLKFAEGLFAMVEQLSGSKVLEAQIKISQENALWRIIKEADQTWVDTHLDDLCPQFKRQTFPWAGLNSSKIDRSSIIVFVTVQLLC